MKPSSQSSLTVTKVMYLAGPYHCSYISLFLPAISIPIMLH
jgi:hypothetical protein